MERSDKLQLFEDKRIRTAWDEEKEEWFFSVVDVVGVLIDASDYQTARNYWKVIRKLSLWRRSRSLCLLRGICFHAWSLKGWPGHGTVHTGYECRVGAGCYWQEAVLTTCGTTVSSGIYGAVGIFAVRWCGILSKNERKRRKRPEKVLGAFSQSGGLGFHCFAKRNDGLLQAVIPFYCL